MNTVSVELKLTPRQYEQLTAIAQAQQMPVAEVAQAAVAEWPEYQAQLERARTGPPIHDAAHPVMSAAGGWADRADLDDLVRDIYTAREHSTGREVTL